MLKVIELFAGVGAQVQGLKDANVPHEIVAISEIDKYALSVYEALHGAVNNLGDIRSIESLPRADLWTYSFPCTDISISGRMKGFEKESGTGSSLLWEVERLLEKARENGNLPKYLLMENVKNIVSKRFKPLFEEWIDYLSSLGYKSFYKVLNAKDYGVPQNRERCFMVSFLNYDGDFSFPNKVPLETKLSDLLEKDVAEKYFLSEKLITNFSSMENRNGFIRGLRFRPQFRDAPFGWTITTNPGSRATDNFIIEPIPCALRGRREEDGKIHQHLEIKKDGITNTLTTVTKDNLILEGLDNSKFMIPQAVKKGYALAEVGDGVYTNRCEFKRGVVQKKMIPTLKTTVSDIGVVVNDPQDLISIRRLTPRECWRLMGWKDESIDIAFSTKVSETQLYKMAGNSIVVNCLTAIFKISLERIMVKATLETLYMSFVSLFISWMIAMPLGTLVSETRPGGLFPHKIANFVLNRLIDLGRSIPFILLVVFLFPFTRLILGTAIGTSAMIIPLTISAIPFEARLIEEILSEVPYATVEAAKIDGASNTKIIIHIKWASKVPYLVNSLSIALINIIGYSAMAGVVGGGGLGNYAIVYGFQRFNWTIIAESMVIIIIIVSMIQIINNLLVRYLLWRCLCLKH